MLDRYTIHSSTKERLMMGALGLVFAFLLFGLFRLQVFQHSQMAELAENNRIRIVPIQPQRGFMYDREGRTIVGNRPSYTLSVVPAEEVKGKTVSSLATLTGFDSSQIRGRMRRNLVSPYQPTPVKRDIQFDVVAALEERNTDFPGVSYTLDQVRLYGQELGAESFTGHVGEVSEQELERFKDSDLRLGTTIGKKGLERKYDRLLRGVEGTEFIEVSAYGEILGPYEGRPPVRPIAGADLYLTIDNDIQAAAVASLDSFCCGAIVAIDPRTGEVLAMTSDPGFDPNVFSSFVSDSLWRSIMADSTHPLLNRPLNGLYPPGSTYKLLTLGAGLESGLIDEHTTFRGCGGGYQFGNRFFRCWEEKGHGTLSAVGAVEQSCDVYFYQLGLKVGVDLLAKYASECGFGRVTGVDLPNESSGNNPNSKYYDKRYGKNGWTKALVLNTAIGQGEILCTPLQLAQFYCGVANFGKVYRPHLVKRIVRPDGETTIIQPELVFSFPFSQKTMAILRQGALMVVQGPHGTAGRLRNKRYQVAGKTGTAQNPHGNEHSWFVGYAPAENPEIVVCAIVENAGHGSAVAAPVVGKVIEAYMTKKLGPPEVAVAPAKPVTPEIPKVQP